ncbi:glycoside hydrolase family 3 C-terminal domain-containing protein [Shewanella gelidimarina]|uniref:glycoside hydrolase family 3 C-terminal domain-containing protein n=1 Tax=Shewanella gelidimarina TaxID=56813 RepID=UPI00200DD232|nr:glycoside hydrolase family 3 C-terminal domain-containing protein [Shewanella gelidimarina]MCL1057918.1 glycoside hydrolase family 3 C-terminal domain-containing protein [Shewanella gelidimarina]
MKCSTTVVIALSSFFVTAPCFAVGELASKTTIYDEVGLIEPVRPLLQSRLTLVEQTIQTLIPQMTLEEKVSLVHANGKFTTAAIKRLGIQEMWLSDGPHGVRHEIERDSWASANWTTDDSTYLPVLTAVAASWNVDMATLHGAVLGSEARHRGKDLILGPGVNLARLPLYGRNFEYLGEDPYLAAKLIVPQIIAIQKNDVAATIKHYALNTQELNRTAVNAKPDERTLREVYLPAFEAAVKQANVYAMMGSYNQFRGTNANQSKHLVMDILKGEWGYKGLLVTDWNVDINTVDAAINGLDLEMGTDVPHYNDYYFAEPLIKMIKAGKVPIAALDDKVARILRVQLSIGMMDNHRLAGQRNIASHRNAARRIAEEGIVLLKNSRQVLPLAQPKVSNILVLGPNLDKKHAQGGGSSEVKSLYEITPLQGLRDKLADNVTITVMRAQSSLLAPISNDYLATRHWTGTPSWNIRFFADDTRRKLINESWVADSEFKPSSLIAKDTPRFITMKAAIKPLKSGVHTLKVTAKGKINIKIDGKTVLQNDGCAANVLTKNISLIHHKEYQFEIEYNGTEGYTLGWDTPNKLFNSEAEYLNAAKKADAVVYFGGLSHSDDRESIDRTDLVLPNQQDEIIAKLIEVNPNTIVFLTAGSAVEMPWKDKVSTIVWNSYSGMEGGHAVADMLFGDVNPSGKMPFTLPKNLADTAPIALNDYNAIESLYSEGVFIGHRWFEQQNIKPLFSFGHGLSYTNFTLSDITLSASSISQGETLTVSVTVTNIGKVAGAEVVQLYLHDKKARVTRPKKELKGFAKVMLQPGESKQVNMQLNHRDLAFWDDKSNNWLAEAGEFDVLLGSSLDYIHLRSTFTLK